MIADEFAGRVALITGAARGLGWAAARRFLAAGARVALNVRRPEQAAALAGELAVLGEPGTRALVLHGDLASAETVRATVEAKLAGTGWDVEIMIEAAC